MANIFGFQFCNCEKMIDGIWNSLKLYALIKLNYPRYNVLDHLKIMLSNTEGAKKIY